MQKLKLQKEQEKVDAEFKEKLAKKKREQLKR